MPWKVDAVSDVRFAFCHAVRSLHAPVAEAARQFGVSRKTAHKWLNVFDALRPPGTDAPASAGHCASSLADRTRRPNHSPGKTPQAVEHSVLEVRDRYNWGPRKVRAFLLQEAQRLGQPPPPGLPSARTVAAILARNGRVAPAAPPTQPQRFERTEPNQLWQVDHKGPVEVERKPVAPFTVIDDHSRFCLAFRPCADKTMATAWQVLWDVFADAGLPEQVLCDNAFNTTGTDAPGLSWFDSRLIRLGIRPAHGRAYHPQTQGKAERFHGSSVREFIHFNARRDRLEHFASDAERWRGVYNTLRPHEALGDQPPLSRWRPSPRRRPTTLPEPQYEPGTPVRKIGSCGEVSFNGYKILVGRGLAGDSVRVEERDRELCVFYCRKLVRSVSTDRLVKDKML